MHKKHIFMQILQTFTLYTQLSKILKASTPEIVSTRPHWTIQPPITILYDLPEVRERSEHFELRFVTHNRENQRTCHVVEGFNDCVLCLLQVKNETEYLHGELVQLSEQVSQPNLLSFQHATELIKSLVVEDYILTVIEGETANLAPFCKYSVLVKILVQKRFYLAVWGLFQLLQHHRIRMWANLDDCQVILRIIRKLRASIQIGTIEGLCVALEWTHKSSDKLYELALKMIQSMRLREVCVGEVDYEPPAESTYDAEEDLSAQDLIDFSPVYRCLHIYTVLGSRETFETYYRKQRKKQARLVLQPPTNMHETIAGYRAYIHGIVGFFVVEDHVLNTGNGLVNRTYLDEVWNMALSKIVNALRTHSAYCTDATLMLKIKNLIMLFNTTLRNYGYSVNQLFDLLHEIRDHYNEVLMQRWVQVFREILDEENFLQLQVSSQPEYDNVLESFPFHDEVLEGAPFPKKFPFSALVPKVYQQVKEYIYACLKFSEDLNLSQAEVTDMIRKSTNLLLTRSFSGCLSSVFRKPSLALMQVIQIIIDTGYLEDASGFLDEFVTNITGAPKEAHSTRIQGQSCMFRVARDDAEKQVCDKLKRKLDEFLELENYDWLLVEPQGHASSFITDLIAFLQSTFQSFTNLPQEVAQEACRSACDHIAKFTLNFMLSDDVKQISMGALQQINLDTIQCEQFAASQPVAGLDEEELLKFFAHLRQLLDLFMSWDWPTYFHDYGQENSKYQHVNPNTAVVLLEKLREADKKTVFSVLKKSERDKKKLLETVLKQLRQLAQTAQQ
ncbi:hypothetical protein PR048_025238 [Dryococelus australis]|uniref:Exocyst complex component n=1 Tax=Dryococelus australis TaxID=614101 RepID=A0ABQ9GQV7_9NEOP|nr:hypothetical protein PR048_025238 [Dryococelus australis]